MKDEKTRPQTSGKIKSPINREEMASIPSLLEQLQRLGWERMEPESPE